MFRKLVSNLAFSPALVGQLGFYAKRLRKEEATRRIGLIFTALALVIQGFAVFQPPEAANASSPDDFVQGGVANTAQYAAIYDANRNNIHDLFDQIGISRQDILNAQLTRVYSVGIWNWALGGHFSAAQGQHTYTVPASGGGSRTFYYWPYNIWGNYTYDAFVGQTASGMWFAIGKDCGNLLLKQLPPAPIGFVKKQTPPTTFTPMCTIPGKTNLPKNDQNCKNDAVAACKSLSVDAITNGYQFTGYSTADYGATVSQYTYVVKKDNTIVLTKSNASNKLSDVYTYAQTTPGTYTVELTVATSLGNKTGADCVKTFTIPKPAMCPQNPSLPKTDVMCQPCPGDSTIWINDSKCTAEFIQTKSATNTAQNADATSVTAKASDQIMYTLNVTNKGKKAATYTVTDAIRDTLEYSTISNSGNGTVDDKGNISWPVVTVKPGEKITRSFVVKMNSTIPAMSTGTSMPESYNCKMTNTFGNNVTVNVDCPIQKQVVQQTVAQLPHTGPRENMLFAGIVLAIVAFFYARARQLKKEVRLIRRDVNAGTI